MKEHPIVLFDGTCNLCSGIVKFLIRNDKRKILRFAAMQSEAGKEILQQYGFPEHYLKTFVFVKNNKAYTGSTAALKLYNELPWYWKWTQAFWIVPRFLRDAVYEFVSKHRFQWFGKKDHCMVPSPELKSRFLD
jgi:predicted DCC family thiol-disulfide oxidoreductase YuxK